MIQWISSFINANSSDMYHKVCTNSNFRRKACAGFQIVCSPDDTAVTFKYQSELFSGLEDFTINSVSTRTANRPVNPWI